MPLSPGKMGLTRWVSAERRPSPCSTVMARRVQSRSGHWGRVIFSGLLYGTDAIFGQATDQRNLREPEPSRAAPRFPDNPVPASCRPTRKLKSAAVRIAVPSMRCIARCRMGRANIGLPFAPTAAMSWPSGRDASGIIAGSGARKGQRRQPGS